MSSTTFGAPFDYDDADVILRSSDQVDFRVHRIILSTFSPFFKTMFSLPQPDAASISRKQNPVVDLPENSRTIAALLTPIYQADSVATEPTSLDDLIIALAAAKKYDMAVVSRHLITKFARSKAVQDDPMVAFCVAYSHELGEAARVAAKASLKHRMNLDNIVDQLQFLNVAAFPQLYKYHRACSAAAAAAVSGSELYWITSSHSISSWQNLANNPQCPQSQSSKCLRHQYRIKKHDTVTTRRYDDYNPYVYWNATTPYYNYITRVHSVLLEHPCREAVTNHIFLEPFYKEGNGCQTCRLTLLGLPEFSRILGEEIERRISEVRHFLAYFLDTSHSIEGRSRVAILTISGLSTFVCSPESSCSEIAGGKTLSLWALVVYHSSGWTGALNLSLVI